MDVDKPTKKSSFAEKIQRKSRYVRLNNETFEEEHSFTLSRFNMLIYLLFSIIVVILLSYLLFSYTALNGLIANVPDSTAEKALIEADRQNLFEIKSISSDSDAQTRYNNNLISLLKGEVPESNIEIGSTIDTTNDYRNILFSNSREDSLLRQKIEAEDQFSISGSSPNNDRDDKMNGVFFFTPLQGDVTNSFGGSKGHNGIDIVAPQNEAVKSTLDGTVIFAGWTTDNGHIIQVQHAHNLISVYKHNSVLLKGEGDKVRAGEPIAIVGNTGELSTAAHLHFELWYNGNSINPQEFITF
ncbi:MAG: M23 family metallopeptidase [Crocinitomicaceae bacterium]|jgi:murein DD-endopeptidase MepM/ murein hydrolase activator NlpD|nr:M23 family metallopeptidase [Crocinitomicaceae bacterium]MBT5402639.1 M23 family metallopeptidase [Crocinitomicaceae bacterium]MBT6030466.1 M23 family metallopeptidase [Crocinitomicaceae bacterium]